VSVEENRKHDMTHAPDAVEIAWYDDDRAALRALFEEAEDSAAQLDAYVEEGCVLVARLDQAVVGHLQLVETGRAGEIELKSTAVAEELRGSGIGTRLVERALAVSRENGYRRMIVATAAADIDNLRFYQRRGFRFDGVDRDAFIPETGYDGIVIDGIPLVDRVSFARPL
jgi:GNAT superfamily N-acetyltransferase